MRTVPIAISRMEYCTACKLSGEGVSSAKGSSADRRDRIPDAQSPADRKSVVLRWRPGAACASQARMEGNAKQRRVNKRVAVPEVGFEPTRPFGHVLAIHMRLPVPPFGHVHENGETR